MSQQTRAGLQSQGKQVASGYSALKVARPGGQRLVDPLLNEHLQSKKYYGVASDHSTQRRGPLAMTSTKAAHPVYVKNLMSQGLHMPSKGLFSYSKATRKPGTAGAPGSRGYQPRRRLNYRDGVRTNELLSAADEAEQNGRHESEYRRNMKNIQML